MDTCAHEYINMLIIFIKKNIGERYIYVYIFLTYTHMKFIVFENYLKYKWINLCKFTNYRQVIIKVYKFVLKIVF